MSGSSAFSSTCWDTQPLSSLATSSLAISSAPIMQKQVRVLREFYCLIFKCTKAADLKLLGLLSFSRLFREWVLLSSHKDLRVWKRGQDQLVGWHVCSKQEWGWFGFNTQTGVKVNLLRCRTSGILPQNLQSLIAYANATTLCPISEDPMFGGWSMPLFVDTVFRATSSTVQYSNKGTDPCRQISYLQDLFKEWRLYNYYYYFFLKAAWW